MSKEKFGDVRTDEVVEVSKPENTHLPMTPSEQMLTPLEFSDYSQFLYSTNYGGKPGQEFTFEGIKTIGLQNGISTGNVRIEFLKKEKTEALFYCTATDRNGDTSENWGAETWYQITEDLKNITDWVKAVQ